MRLRVLLIGVVPFMVIGAMTQVATAQNIGADPCGDALVLSQVSVNGRYSHDVRLARYVSRNVYDSERQSLGVNAELYGIPIGASYEDYRNRADQELQQESESISDREAYNMLFVGLDPASSTNYANCLIAHLDRYGLHMFLVGATPTDITVEIRWEPQGRTEPPTIPVTWDVPSSLRSYKVLPRSVTQGQTYVIFQRPTQEETIALNYQGFGSEAVLTPLPPPSKEGAPDRELYTLAPGPNGSTPVVASVIANNTHHPDEKNYPEQQCYTPPPGDAFVPVQEEPYPGGNNEPQDEDTHGRPSYCFPSVSCEPDNVRCWDIHLLQGCDVSKKWLAWYRVWIVQNGKKYDPAFVCDANAPANLFKSMKAQDFSVKPK